MDAEDGGAAEEFAAAVRARVVQARADLAEAASRQDGSAVQEAVDELEEALSTARAHDVELPGPGIIDSEPPAHGGPEGGETESGRSS
ncbi:hypothetical protein [Yinghuangia sp. YIM S09857]|uniref:hypothetical protein n=1 Tax=Yinghuangia sp. YIM S09857 TaxID=3436929 RepID=UPI003F52D8EE